jgi:hypothetical protein
MVAVKHTLLTPGAWGVLVKYQIPGLLSFLLALAGGYLSKLTFEAEVSCASARVVFSSVDRPDLLSCASSSCGL